MLQGPPGPPVHVVAKFVHEQDAGGMAIAFFVGHAEQWLSSTTLPCHVHVIVELGASRFQSGVDLHLGADVVVVLQAVNLGDESMRISTKKREEVLIVVLIIMPFVERPTKNATIGLHFGARKDAFRCTINETK
jgi:hypothetical protein